MALARFGTSGRAVRGIVGFAVFLALRPAPAQAGPAEIARGLELYEAGELDRALEAFERALAEGGNDAAAMLRVYVHLGVLRAGAGDHDGAVSAFRSLLTLDPSAAPPADVSPTIREPFDEARASHGDAPGLRARVDEAASREVGEPHAALVAVESDSEGLVRAARAQIVSGGGAGTTLDSRGDPPWRLAFPAAATAEAGELRYRLDLIDAYGSVLASEGPRTVSVFEPGRRGGGSILSSPFFWGGAAVVVAGGAVLAVVLATSGSGKATVGAPEFVR